MRWQLIKYLMSWLLVECRWNVLLFLLVGEYVLLVLGRHMSLMRDWLMTGRYDGSLRLVCLVIGAIGDHTTVDVLNWVNFVLVEHVKGRIPIRGWQWVQRRRLMWYRLSLLNLCLFEWPRVRLLSWTQAIPNLNWVIRSWHWSDLIWEWSHLVIIDLVGFPLWEMILWTVLHLWCVCQ